MPGEAEVPFFAPDVVKRGPGRRTGCIVMATCLVLWAVLALVGTLVFFAGRQTCTLPANTDNDMCSFLWVAVAMAVSAVTLAFCVIGAVFVHAWLNNK
jgi:hypothetical protein